MFPFILETPTGVCCPAQRSSCLGILLGPSTLADRPISFCTLLSIQLISVLGKHLVIGHLFFPAFLLVSSAFLCFFIGHRLGFTFSGLDRNGPNKPDRTRLCGPYVSSGTGYSNHFGYYSDKTFRLKYGTAILPKR